ncbi:ribonuclease H-like domain-containing protein [Tanacetum coccineum]
MDLKWQLALLSMRARKYYQRTGKKITINGSDTAGYDKTKVECFNCHKMGHFARECRSPRHQDSRPRNQDNSRKTVNVEEPSSKAMVVIDGAGFDWSFMADEEVPTNMALMAFSDSEFNKSEFDLANYKRGLAYVEEQLVFYKKNEIENLKKEKESNKIKIDSFENDSKSLDKLIGSQIYDNNRKGMGFESYNIVAPPPTGLFTPLTIDLSNSSLEEFQKPEFEGYSLKFCDSDDDKCEVKETDNVQHKHEQANQPRKVSQDPRNKRTNWNKKKTQKLGVGFQVTKKAFFVCGSFNHLIKDCDFHDKKMVQKTILNNEQKGTGQREVRPVWNNTMRTNHQNFSNSRRNFAPTAVLTKSGLVPTNTARQSSSRVVVPVNFVNTAEGKRVTSAVGKQGINAVKSSACWVWRPTRKVIDHGDPQVTLKDTGIFDSGCSRHMTSVTPPNWVAAEYGSGACYFSDQ